jgi:hypothetical protein
LLTVSLIRTVGLVRKDYVLRMLEQLAQALARIAGAKKKKDLDEAQQIAEGALADLFGPTRDLLERLDAKSAATLLSDDDKLRAYATLVMELASIEELRGDERRARSGHRRALELFLVAPRDAKSAEAIAALRAKLEELTSPRR